MHCEVLFAKAQADVVWVKDSGASHADPGVDADGNPAIRKDLSPAIGDREICSSCAQTCLSGLLYCSHCGTRTGNRVDAQERRKAEESALEIVSKNHPEEGAVALKPRGGIKHRPHVTTIEETAAKHYLKARKGRPVTFFRWFNIVVFMGF